VEAVVAALRAFAAPLPAEHIKYFKCWVTTLLLLLRGHPTHKHKAAAVGAIEVLVAHMGASAGAAVFSLTCCLLYHLLEGTGHDARAVLAGALEAAESQRAETAGHETARLQLIRNLQPAAQRHDAEPCAVAGCKRCAAARDSGVMCALPGCGARVRDGGAKKLLRCGTCRAACYCGATHQREDWRRHKDACGTPLRDDADKQAGGASGS
jgi:hypothetical protein